jgi:putative transposase
MNEPACYDIRQVADALAIHKSVAEKRAKKEAWPYAEVSTRGGKKRIYPLTTLPTQVKTVLLMREQIAVQAPKEPRKNGKLGIYSEAQVQSFWALYERSTDKHKDIAKRRQAALMTIDTLVQQGMPLMQARAQVSLQLRRDRLSGGSSPSALGHWAKRVQGASRHDWTALLIPDWCGRKKTSEIEPAAWGIYKDNYLRPERPSSSSCYRLVERTAKTNPHWAPLPNEKTFLRRVRRELLPQTIVLAREGLEAAEKGFPAQERDRSGFAALEGVNADGHMFDVAVTFPDGTTGRPIILGWQDLYSGKILAWRMDQTESSDLVRLSFCDLVRTYGIPGKCWLDNGRAFASKKITGGSANRYRFKVKEEDPEGIISALGTQVHWVKPYHGQSKPIERAWRDFCDSIAKHPAFAGAYLGNNVMNKPENYGSRTVPWADFERVVNEEIAAHNARPGRRSKVCAGRSFDDTFAEAYSRATIRKASSEQLRTLLLAAEAVSASATDGSVRLSGNRYWVEALSAYAGRKVVVRFDPMSLHTAVHVYQLNGVYIGEAACIASVGFADTNAAREHARAKKTWVRAAKTQLEAERRMTAAEVAAQLPSMPPAQLPPAAVIAPVFGNKIKKPEVVDDGRESALARMLEREGQRLIDKAL